MHEGQEGLVQVLTGGGRGKTTAALGTVIRAVGQGLRVHIIHFMKGTYPYGEHKALAQLPNITVSRFGKLDFVDPNNVQDDERKEAEDALAASREAMLSGDYDLIIRDEVNIASGWGLVPVDKVIDLIRDKPEGVELILTGRYADPRLIEIADLVTEMVEIKHPYQRGTKARRGIEY